MGYKQMDNNFSFMYLSLINSMERNRYVSRMEKINAIINWSSIESLLLKYYSVGKEWDILKKENTHDSYHTTGFPM